MKPLARRVGLTLAAVGLVVALAPPAVSAAKANNGDSSFPINEFTQLEVHIRVNCMLATQNCNFDTQANLRTPDGVTGFPADLWSRQSTQLRSSDRLSYFETQINGGPLTKKFKEGGPEVVTTIFLGDGPPEKYSINGIISPVSWATGQPKTDGDVIVCANIQVVFGGNNITSPSTCAQTTFS